jgi:hypothetical protein
MSPRLSQGSRLSRQALARPGWSRKVLQDNGFRGHIGGCAAWSLNDSIFGHFSDGTVERTAWTTRLSRTAISG